MEDVAREPEAILPDRGAACLNVNMTSVDSGVETGNDSNDSSIIQSDGQQLQAVENEDVTANINTIFTRELLPCSMPSFVPFVIPEVPVCYCEKKYPKNCDIEQSCPSNPDFLLDKLRVCNAKIQFKTKLLQAANKTSSLPIRFKYNYHSKIKTRWRMNHFDRMVFLERRIRLAATTNNIDLLKRLLDLGVSPNCHDNHGRTPLHLAACRGYTDIVRLLLEHGADPNQRDCIGNTPLHLAAVTSKLSVVTLLLTAGTDVLASDTFGYNPLQLAKTKLRMLQRNCHTEDMIKIKDEMRNIISMLMVYLQKQKNMREQVETLSNFCSRLSLSNTSDQVQDDVKDLLANLNDLSITG
ncbi:hypothetical protein P5V15_005204 [Pogonomyrmex californicus]